MQALAHHDYYIMSSSSALLMRFTSSEFFPGKQFICTNKCKNIFTKMLKDVGIEVPKSIETRSKYTMHADKGRDDSMQQS